MANWTAITGITGIVVSGAVGPWISARWAARRTEREHEHARVLADRAELRILLDEAEQAMLAGERIASMAPALLKTRALHPAPVPPQIGELHKAMGDMDRQGGRLTLRLGPDAVAAAAYRQAFNAFQAVAGALSHLGTTGSGMYFVITEDDHQRRKSVASESIAIATAAHDAFLAAANGLVASQLAPRQPRARFYRRR